MTPDTLERTLMLPSAPLAPAGGQNPFSELRDRAVKVLEHSALPTIKDEEWKYTSLRRLEGLSFSSETVDVSIDDAAPWMFSTIEQIRIVFVDGVFAPSLGTSLDGADGLSLAPLSSGALAPELGTLVKLEEFVFGAQNSASFVDGAVIRVSRNAKVERLVHVMHLTTAGSTGARLAAPRLLIVAEEGSDVRVLESYASVGEGDSLVVPVVEILLAPNAHIEHVRLQRESRRSVHIGLTEVKQERDSSLNTYNIVYGGGLTRNDINVFLNGSNLHSRMDGVVAVDGDQHVDNHTRLDHAFPHCDSFEVYKHVLGDRSSAVFNGKIFVHQDAQKTDAKQTNQAILLSPDATINSKPQLEIFADDVKCTHGATVGQLDDDPLFYLRSRGIPKGEARALMVYAFAAEVLEKITHEELRKELERLLFEKLGVA